jgi:hypothetical protein
MDIILTFTLGIVLAYGCYAFRLWTFQTYTFVILLGSVLVLMEELMAFADWGIVIGLGLIVICLYLSERWNLVQCGDEWDIERLKQEIIFATFEE